MTRWIEKCFVKTYLLINYLQKEANDIEERNEELSLGSPRCLITLIGSHPHPS